MGIRMRKHRIGFLKIGWPQIAKVQLNSVTQSCPTLFNPMGCSTPASLSITNSQNLLKLMSIESVMPSNHLIFCRPFLLPPSIFPSIRVFSNESVLHIRWLNYWSFSFSISPSNEYSGLICFRMDWLDLLAAQGSLRIAKVHIKGIISVSPNCCIFPYTEKSAEFFSLSNFLLLTIIFWYSDYLMFSSKTSIYPGSPLHLQNLPLQNSFLALSEMLYSRLEVLRMSAKENMTLSF